MEGGQGQEAQQQEGNTPGEGQGDRKEGGGGREGKVGRGRRRQSCGMVTLTASK